MDVQASVLPVAAPETEHFRAVLTELVDLGAAMARLVHRRMAEQAEDGVLDDRSLETATVAFERVARCVRRTVALARTLDAPVRAPVVRAAAVGADRERVLARVRVIRGVEDAIHRRRETTDELDESDVERLHEDLRERMDRPEFDDDLGSRPVAEIIEEIRRDLGIASYPGPCKQRTPDEVSAVWARARAQPGEAARVAMTELTVRENPWPGDPRRLWT